MSYCLTIFYGIIGSIMLILLLPPPCVYLFISKQYYIKPKLKKSIDNISFPSSNISTSLITPDSSPYSSKANTPQRHKHSLSSNDYTHIYKQLFK